MVDRLTKLPFHFWISQNIKTLDQKKEIARLELSRRIAHSMVSGSANVADLESESKFGHIEELLRELMNGSERLVSMSLTVIFWGETREELEEKSEEILRAFRSMNQAEGLAESFALEDAFFRSAPMVCEGFRPSKMKSSNCAHLMPLYACWTGNKPPVVLLTNREGTPFGIDVFASALPSWNGVIFGTSGGGKSFTVSQLMLQFCNQTTGGGGKRPKIVWIDNGASSEKLIEVMDGEFIDLTLESGICLNMFDLEGGEAQPSPAKIKLILGCLELILKDEDRPGLPKREKALLEECIFKCYGNAGAQMPTLSTLREVLAAHPVPDMRKHADILYSWTGETAYGRMLDRQTNVRLEKDLVSIEIKGLDNHRELKDIALLLLTSYIKSEAAADLARPYLLIVDEAHRLFKSSAMGREFAIDSVRVFRKYRAGLWLISQNYRDFLSDPELADSLMPNTSFVVILRQRKIDWEDFKTTFDFNDAQVEAVKSLEIVKGKYSEFFMMQDESQGVVRLEPEPLSYWICTTDGSDKARIAELQAKKPGRPLLEILGQLAKGETHNENENLAA
jgi:conjugal transfer ATP-binding protein TraC